MDYRRFISILSLLSIYIDLSLCISSLSINSSPLNSASISRFKLDPLWSITRELVGGSNSNAVSAFEIASRKLHTVLHSPKPDENFMLSFVAECKLPTPLGEFKMRAYRYISTKYALEPIVLMVGDVSGQHSVPVRVHDQCFTSEVFGSLRCDCKDQLTSSLKYIQNNGGIVVYLQQEGRGIGISNKIAAYALQDRGFDTVDANLHLGFNDDDREYHMLPGILKDLGIQSISLMTNNPRKIDHLRSLGVQVNQRIPIEIVANSHNTKYLQAKKDRMSHMLGQSFH